MERNGWKQKMTPEAKKAHHRECCRKWYWNNPDKAKEYLKRIWERKAGHDIPEKVGEWKGQDLTPEAMELRKAYCLP